MGLSLANRSSLSANLAAARLVANADDALDHEKSDREGYLESGDVDKLVFLEGKKPAVFLCNFKWDAKASRIVGDAQNAGRGSDGKPALSTGSWAYAVARVSIRSIDNSPDVPVEHHLKLSFSADGYLDEKTLTMLTEFGVVDDCFALWAGLTQKKARSTEAKNS